MCSISCTTTKYSILKFCRLNLSLSLCWKSIQVGKQFRDGTRLKSFTTSNRELGSPNMPQSGPWLIHKTGNCINSGNRICTWTQIITKEQRNFFCFRLIFWLIRGHLNFLPKASGNFKPFFLPLPETLYIF